MWVLVRYCATAAANLSTAEETANDAEHNARDDDDENDGEYDDYPHLQVEAAVLEQIAAALVIVEHGARRAFSADQRDRTPCCALFCRRHVVDCLLHVAECRHCQHRHHH